MRALLALAAFALATPAAAQISNPGMSPTEVEALMPQPATVPPPSVADSGAIGTTPTRYALENHTHASKARKGRILVPVSGVFDVAFSMPFPSGNAPLCVTTAETTAGDTAVVNTQIDGATSSTGFRIRITRTQQSVVALLGLTILSVPTQIATYAHYICIEP